MTIQFFCPSGHRLSAPEDQVGRTVRCPACKQVAIVPSHGAAKAIAEGEAPEADAAPAEGSPAAEEPSPEGAGGGKPLVLPSRPKPPPRKPPKLKLPIPAPATPGIGPPKPPLPELPVAELPGKHAAKEADEQNGPGEPKPLPTLPPRRRGWFRREPKVMGPHVYQPDPGRIQTIRWLALIVGAVVLFSLGPAVMHLNVETAPGWARAVLLMGAVQIVFILWMLATPDWASVWVLMLVFGFVSTVYAVGTAVALATPLDAPMPLGMGQIRAWAGPWFASVLAVECLATYLCGRTATRWRHMLRLEMAGRDAPSNKVGRVTP
jgi:hypothetical protein